MAKLTDNSKLLTWKKRLKRFETSGLTVARFCQLEKTSPHMFYYWSRRVAQVAASSSGNRPKGQDVGQRGEISSASTEVIDPQLAGPESLVHFTFDGGWRLSIPADSLETIRCVLDWSRSQANFDGERVSMTASGRSSAFRQVSVVS